MTHEKKPTPWKERTTEAKDYRDPETFRRAKEQVRTVPINATIAETYVPTNIAKILRDEFAALKGNTQSDVGLFGMLDTYDEHTGEFGLSVGMVGEDEKKWFRDVAQFGHRVLNALLNKDLDASNNLTDNRNALNAAVLSGEPGKAKLILELQTATNAIEQAFPSQQRGAAM